MESSIATQQKKSLKKIDDAHFKKKKKVSTYEKRDHTQNHPILQAVRSSDMKALLPKKGKEEKEASHIFAHTSDELIKINDNDFKNLYEPFFNTCQETLNLHKTMALESSHTTNSLFEHALKLFAPLTIFSPDIVQDTLQKAHITFYEKLEKKPETLGSIAVKHFEKQQKLFLETLARMQGDYYETVIDSPKNDRRFQNPLWETVTYFSFIKQNYLLLSELITDMVSQLDTLESDALNKIRFYATQLIEALSPTNFPATNPDVLATTLRTKGENLKQGLENFFKDAKKGFLGMTDMTAFRVGENIAATQGNVVFENDLLQLIHYQPTCEKIYQIPLLIVPAWINKFYLFDLTEKSSFVKWCLDKGMDVYIISWVNPDKQHAKKTFCDYTLDGLYKAVEEIQKLSQNRQINVLANCAGGILLNCLMAYLESHHIPSPFASATTLASPIDANKLGDLKTFICKDQIKMLEDSLEDFGIIPGHILMQSFNLLRPSDLLWSFYIKHYLLGESPQPFDILFWNCDSTNLPGRMHSQYLRHIFLENKLLKKNAMRIAGTPIDLSKITTPAFIVGAKKDHIVPWDSVYPLSQIISSSIKEFILVGSGHVAGIINPPSRNKYSYWTNPTLKEDATEWVKTTTEHSGSWWSYWFDWVEPFLGETREPRIEIDSIEPAPGRYVRERSLVETK